MYEQVNEFIPEDPGICLLCSYRFRVEFPLLIMIHAAYHTLDLKKKLLVPGICSLFSYGFRVEFVFSTQDPCSLPHILRH